MIRTSLFLASCLALAACGDKTAQPQQTGDEEATARGEVLGGTISDDMLPLDTLQSQSPPLAEETVSSGTDRSDAASSPEPEPASEEASEPEPAPAEAPEAAE